MAGSRRYIRGRSPVPRRPGHPHRHNRRDRGRVAVPHRTARGHRCPDVKRDLVGTAASRQTPRGRERSPPDRQYVGRLSARVERELRTATAPARSAGCALARDVESRGPAGPSCLAYARGSRTNRAEPRWLWKSRTQHSEAPHVEPGRIQPCDVPGRSRKRSWDGGGRAELSGRRWHRATRWRCNGAFGRQLTGYGRRWIGRPRRSCRIWRFGAASRSVARRSDAPCWGS